MTLPSEQPKKKRSLLNKKPVMVGLSFLALSSMGGSRAARAQTLSCALIDFGSVSACAGTGTVTVSSAGGVSTGGCVTVGGSQTVGRCTVFNTAGFPFKAIRVTLAAATATIASGAQKMTVNGFDFNSAGKATFTFTGLNATIDIGATLNVGNGQASGNYTGTISVNANYIP